MANFGLISIARRTSGTAEAEPFVKATFQAALKARNASSEEVVTYDAWIFDPTSSTISSVVVTPELYQIDPTTGLATVIGPTALGIGGVVDVNGTNYAFDDITNQILSLHLANGSTRVAGTFDSSAGVIQ